MKNYNRNILFSGARLADIGKRILGCELFFNSEPGTLNSELSFSGVRLADYGSVLWTD